MELQNKHPQLHAPKIFAYSLKSWLKMYMECVILGSSFDIFMFTGKNASATKQPGTFGAKIHFKLFGYCLNLALGMTPESCS